MMQYTTVLLLVPVVPAFFFWRASPLNRVMWLDILFALFGVGTDVYANWSMPTAHSCDGQSVTYISVRVVMMSSWGNASGN